MDPATPNVLRWDDIGLTLILDFISEAEEKTMIQAFHARDPLREGKRRISQHFGHHFDYTTFGASETHFTPVPDYITAFLPRLPLQEPRDLPDQFTVQYYPPGAGIPPHVDTHSMFGEALYSLSFGSAVPMQFRLAGPNEARKMRLPKRSAQSQSASEVASESTQASASPCPPDTPPNQPAAAGEEKETEERQAPFWELVLPPRSLLLMTGPSRYGYTHAIRPRKTDVGADGTVVQRRGRYSITMRTVRRGDEVGCDCAYPGVCDARIREEEERVARGDGGSQGQRGNGSSE
jgi:alkylated DNA repair protein alkB family protein 8